MNLCSNYSIKGCPASSYLSCPAYLEGKNCWEVEIAKPCCKAECAHDCMGCDVLRSEEIRKELEKV
jgi:hypothetical protein